MSPNKEIIKHPGTIHDMFKEYIESISIKFSYTETSEMGYRADFEILLKGVFQSISVKRIDHDAKARKGNKPDFVILNSDVPILYIETKDIGSPLDKIENSEQMSRYFGYTNLVLTDYIEFRFYRNGIRYENPIKIADSHIKNRIITPIPENYHRVASTLLDFSQSHKEPIRSGKHLAKILGGKAQRIRDNIKQFLSVESERNAEIKGVYWTIRNKLVHDLTHESFSDMYAQTLVYGLFVARYYDEVPENFSRQKARELVPASNPLLRHFFDHIVGPDFDKRLEYIVNELCEVFLHANVQELMKEYYQKDLWGETHKIDFPVIYFYEDFLKEYDPQLRKKFGAFYTPLPVVRFIVRSVDYILKKEFNLYAGLSDTSKTKTGIHRVQILDPSVGTGTFISAIIREIYLQLKKSGQDGRWHTYVHNDLLPRLHGFEIMIVPYTIAHLKLSMAFKETGFKYFNKRLGIYLTNSLEESTDEAIPKQKNLFGEWGFAKSITDESKAASSIKNQKPIMIVIGNPPYSSVSSNETEFANRLVQKYKLEPGSNQKLQERKHWLNDDYVKFIAFAEDMVSKNGEGIIGFITNHGYIDNPTFRGMRWHLMETFDALYIIDLHGNSNKKEIAPDGSKDENVFDIQQGVAIILAIKSEKKNKNLAKVYHFDIWGKRESKFAQLTRLSIENIKWTNLKPRFPNYFLAPEGSVELGNQYQQGFSICECFLEYTSGIVTMGDGFIVSEDKDVLEERINNFLVESISENSLKEKYDLGKNYAKWIIQNKKEIVIDYNKIVPFIYRPFDNRYAYFDNKLIWRPRTNIMKHFINGFNVGLIVPKQLTPDEDAGGYITKSIGGHKTFSAFNSNYYFPLYQYLEDGSQISNMNDKIEEEIKSRIGDASFEEIFDYIYSILHSLKYRQKYKVFLKIDFPRIPYPKDLKSFKELVVFGNELRILHLLESPKIYQFITTYPIAGSNIVNKLNYSDNNVYINKDQYFGNVPESSWNFHIGGYQPAQKWLKDRMNRPLNNDDIEHYQKIIVALTETQQVMVKIDQIEF